jgi:hypothetical protein
MCAPLSTPTPTPQFTDEWVASHYPQFSSAADMRDALTSATSVERLRALEDDVKVRVCVVCACTGGGGGGGEDLDACCRGLIPL